MKVQIVTKKSKAMLCSGSSSSGTGAVDVNKSEKSDSKVQIVTKKSKAMLCSGSSSSGTGLILK
ncbi:MAG: hypothetical protein ACKUBY_04020 [Candidatus Moraniibacteriota bacterium]|jgi:hypothetical protein